MRRFNYEENEDKDDVENIFNMDDDDDDDDGNHEHISDAEMEAMIEHQRHQEAFNLAQIGLVSYELDQKLLSQAIRMCEKGWFWKFKSLGTQLKCIAKTYLALERIIELARTKREKEGNA